MALHPAEIDTGFVLIVDDSAINLKVAQTILSGHGFQTHTISEAVEVQAWAEANQPDLVLLDIMMPDVDGIEVCRRLKANPKTCDIPVVFLTAKVDTEDLVIGFSAGGADYLTKPFKAEELIVRIRSHIHLRRLQREMMKKNAALKESLEQIAKLKSAMLVICAWTKEVKVDNQWISIENYLSSHLGLQLSHGISNNGQQMFAASSDQASIFIGRDEVR